MTEKQTRKPAKKDPAQAQGASQGVIKVEQIGSATGRRHDQRETLIGLGLNKMRRTSELPDTPSVRGMIYKVKHLVKVVG